MYTYKIMPCKYGTSEGFAIAIFQDGKLRMSDGAYPTETVAESAVERYLFAIASEEGMLQFVKPV